MTTQKKRSPRKGYWGRTLNPAQRSAVDEIRHPFRDAHVKVTADAFMVYMQPSTGKAKYLELRRYSKDEHQLLQAWVIALDGTYFEKDLNAAQAA